VLRRTVVKDILAAIDAEIATLEQAKALLRASGAVVAKRKLGRPAKAASVVVPKVQKARKRRKMSVEARERIRQAQIKRWAALKTPKENLNASVAPLPKAKKKAAKAA
jgi:hypothetical protein